MKKAIIVDIDGTLVFVGDRSYFDASKAHLVDKPNVPVVNLVKKYLGTDTYVFFITGRSAKNGGKNATRTQLKNLFGDFVFNHSVLFMRESNDFRSDTIFKGEIFANHIKDKFNVEFVLEDRNSMVRFYRSELNLPCFQVNPDTGTGRRKKKEGISVLNAWIDEYGNLFKIEKTLKFLKILF